MMKTQLRTEHIPTILGLSAKGLRWLSTQMAREYCLWWCGQANTLDAELLFGNRDFQAWWSEHWEVQDERFLMFAIQVKGYEGGLLSKAMMEKYLVFHRGANEDVKPTGELQMWKTLLPMDVQRSWLNEIKGMNRGLRELISTISDN